MVPGIDHNPNHMLEVQSQHAIDGDNRLLWQTGRRLARGLRAVKAMPSPGTWRSSIVRVRNAVVLLLAFAPGCGPPPPTVTEGTFTDSYTLTMQRGITDVVVKTSGAGSYRVTNYRMDHPMGKRPDTEATFKTSAGTFVVSDRGLTEDGVKINDTFYKYPEPSEVNGRGKVVIDERGGVTVHAPKAEPKGEQP